MLPDSAGAEMQDIRKDGVVKTNYDSAIKFVLFYEKYRSDVKGDPGGLTIWGICTRYWPDVVARMNAMTEDGSRTHASAFYRSIYWDVIGADDLPDLMDIVLFDCAVNQGAGIAKQIKNYAKDWRDALILRVDKYDDASFFDRFGRGWDKRIVSLRDYIASGFQVLEWDKTEMVRAIQ
jgi:lysozyme family protein